MESVLTLVRSGPPAPASSMWDVSGGGSVTSWSRALRGRWKMLRRSAVGREAV